MAPSPSTPPHAPILSVDPVPRAGSPERPEDEGRYGDVVLIIDVLRATTTVPLVLEGGATRVGLTASHRVARSVAAEDGGWLLGERRGVPPEGFNFGNAPATLAGRTFDGPALLVSENAPLAAAATADARRVTLASLVNAGAVVADALARARERIDVVACGFRGAPGLDDLLVAGFLADRLLRGRDDLVPTGATQMALDLMRAERDPLRLLYASRSGRYLRRLGLDADVGASADLDRVDVVPVLTAREARHGGDVFAFASADAP